MLESFVSYIKHNHLFEKKDAILLAVSGGVDSVVMTELFQKAKFNFAIAHCNFQLRGKEADGDEKFVNALADKYGMTFYCKRFDTLKEAESRKVSIQMAARDMRYRWFEQLLSEEGYRYIATAHHLDDSVETFFINLLRGTGIDGITGIEMKSNHVIRPLLFARRREIASYAKSNGIKFRNDSSNESDDYLRNKIRHQLIPILKSLNPKFEETMSANMNNFRFAAQIFREDINQHIQKLLKQENEYFSIASSDLKKSENADHLLYELLQPYGINISQCKAILQDGLTQSGREFFTGNYRIVRDRDKILIQPLQKVSATLLKIDAKKKKIKTDQFELLTSTIKRPTYIAYPPTNMEQWIDADKLKFPITLRKWEPGDYFYPLGMKHRKKLSDYFIDTKTSLIDKENAYLLQSENKIVCILGHRIDNRFKVTDKTKKIYKIKVISLVVIQETGQNRPPHVRGLRFKV